MDMEDQVQNTTHHLVIQMKNEIANLYENNVDLKQELSLLKKEIEFNRNLLKELLEIKKPNHAIITLNKYTQSEENYNDKDEVQTRANNLGDASTKCNIDVAYLSVHSDENEIEPTTSRIDATELSYVDKNANYIPCLRVNTEAESECKGTKVLKTNKSKYVDDDNNHEADVCYSPVQNRYIWTGFNRSNKQYFRNEDKSNVIENRNATSPKDDENRIHTNKDFEKDNTQRESCGSCTPSYGARRCNSARRNKDSENVTRQRESYRSWTPYYGARRRSSVSPYQFQRGNSLPLKEKRADHYFQLQRKNTYISAGKKRDNETEVDSMSKKNKRIQKSTYNSENFETNSSSTSKMQKDVCKNETTDNDVCFRKDNANTRVEHKLKTARCTKAKQCKKHKVGDNGDFKFSCNDGFIKADTTYFDKRHLPGPSSSTLCKDRRVYIEDASEDENEINEISDLKQASDDEEMHSHIPGRRWKERNGTQRELTKSSSSSENEEVSQLSQPSGTQFHMFANKYANNLTRCPIHIPGVQCGFLEYPYGYRVPCDKQRNSDCGSDYNTSSDSHVQAGSMHMHEYPANGHIAVNINGDQRLIDMQLIGPYLKVIYHGGRHHVDDQCHDIVVFVAHFLPTKGIENYKIIMEQLFFYCVHAMNLLVKDTYKIVFFNSAVDSSNMPTHRWIKKYYDMVFYRLRKNLSGIYFVHQSLWLKTALKFSKLFLSTNCSQKIHLIQNIHDLQKYIPLDYIFIPHNVYKVDKTFK